MGRRARYNVDYNLGRRDPIRLEGIRLSRKILKKGDLGLCSNYRGISLQSVPSKVDQILRDKQAVFRSLPMVNNRTART